MFQFSGFFLGGLFKLYNVQCWLLRPLLVDLTDGADWGDAVEEEEGEPAGDERAHYQTCTDSHKNAYRKLLNMYNRYSAICSKHYQISGQVKIELRPLPKAI